MHINPIHKPVRLNALKHTHLHCLLRLTVGHFLQIQVEAKTADKAYSEDTKQSGVHEEIARTKPL